MTQRRAAVRAAIEAIVDVRGGAKVGGRIASSSRSSLYRCSPRGQISIAATLTGCGKQSLFESLHDNLQMMAMLDALAKTTSHTKMLPWVSQCPLRACLDCRSCMIHHYERHKVHYLSRQYIFFIFFGRGSLYCPVKASSGFFDTPHFSSKVSSSLCVRMWPIVMFVSSL